MNEGINIEQFKTINELYSFIDENAFELDKNDDLTRLWVKYRNHSEHEDEKMKAQWEVEFSSFVIKGSQPFSLVYSSGENVDLVKKYPDLNEIQKSVLIYLQERAKSSLSSLMKARYYHLLWKCPSGIRNNSYAFSAIENYISAIKEYYNFYQNEKDDLIPLCISWKYENLVAISSKVKSDICDLKELTNFLLFRVSDLEFHTLHSIIENMLEYPKLFKPKDFERSLALFEEEINKKEFDDFSLAKYYLPTAIKIATKLKTDVKKWHNEVGLAYIRIAKEEIEEDRNWIKLKFYFEAITAFKLSGNNDKRKEVELLYAELKPHIKLSSFRMDFSKETITKLKEKDNYIKIKAEEILLRPYNEVYKIITCGIFFPKYKEVINESKNNEKSFLDHITPIYFDVNKNLSLHSKETGNEREIYKIYGYLVNENVLPYLYYIFIPGIKSGHLTFNNFINYLANYTWLGIPHAKYDLGGDEKITNWVGLIAPSIIEFFIQIQAWVSSNYYTPSFILCIDSLTLKMEGLFRDYCERMKIPTSVSRKKGMEEVYINNILENENLKKYFNEDELLFFKYLFANEGGLNLRNNIAHCFYDYQEYSVNKMLLLIAALLQLGKYKAK